MKQLHKYMLDCNSNNPASQGAPCGGGGHRRGHRVGVIGGDTMQE